MPRNITDQEFETAVLKSDKPVLVDFWAEWCGPCKMIAPVLEELSKDFAGKVEIVKVNIDENMMTPGKYGVRSIPTLMIFKNGELKGQEVGNQSKAKLTNWLNSVLAA
ncbi:MAG: thioredoxin [Dongiaceae bacterium]